MQHRWDYCYLLLRHSRKTWQTQPLSLPGHFLDNTFNSEAVFTFAKCGKEYDCNSDSVIAYLGFLGQCNTVSYMVISYCITEGSHGKFRHCHSHSIFLTTHSITKQYLHWQSVVKRMIKTGIVAVNAVTLASLGDAT